jgi:hypothetical protein
MSTADNFRQFAEESLESARTALSDDERKNFLDLYKTWMMAARQSEDGLHHLADLSDPAVHRQA